MKRSAKAILFASAAAIAQPGLAQEGFVISIDGAAITGDARVTDVARRTDVALANADVQVRFDGLAIAPRLDVEVIGSGPSVTLQSALNYPAFVSRAEMRIIDRAALGSARVVQVADVSPNGRVDVTLPEGDLVVVHRVYDANGRYDETAPLSLNRRDDRGLSDGVEDGSDGTAVRNIRVAGGGITVSGTDVVRGARVTALGEVVQPDAQGGFVIQRILPAGDYGVDVAVKGRGQNVALTRDVTIPSAEWFTVATADLTFGRRDGETYSTGRFAGFINGKTDSGLRIIASADTGEGDLKDAFRRLDDRDPRQLLLRVDPDDLYPTYGDDSTVEDLTPTSGLVFLRIEKDRNYIQWGDFDATLGDNKFVNNQRSLYGLSARVETQQTVANGAARATGLAYAAQPDQLPQRDVFLGTGGTVYFLGKQDVTQASETLSIQLRDADTGRVVETKTLVAGKDYAINYIQGIVTLTRPLESSAANGLFDIGSAQADDVVLVAAYEHTPTIGDVDGYAIGARAEVWATDQLRFGLSGMRDQTGATDHDVVGVDALYQLSEQTFVRLDIAQSEGTGFDSTYSADGGLIVQNVAGAGTSGTAVKIAAQASLTELGFARDGAIGGYFEQRSEGFASLDTQVTATTGDETFWGVFADVAVNEQLTFSLDYDAYENTAGGRDNSGSVQAEYAVNDAVTVAVGIENQDKTTGSRTDVAARLGYTLSNDAKVYVFGQATIDNDTLPENNRFGIGGSVDVSENWTLSGEVSDGSLGTGGRLAFNYNDDAGNTRYLGYEIEPGRDLDGIALQGRDRGRIVAGGTQAVSGTVDMFGENTYDVFGQHRSLTSAYGLTYRPNDNWTYSTAFEMGRVDNGGTYDFERTALSFGMQFTDAQIDASGRIEYRLEDGLLNSVDVNSDTLLVSADAQYKIDETQRLLFSADLATSETAQSTLLDGNYADVVIGYALRPVEDDKLNILARYRHLYDAYGLRDAQATDGPRQRSHVISLDGSYDVNPQWTVGGKLGYRMSETAQNSTAAFVQNDAWLAVANARYHMVHEWDALLEIRQLNLVDAQTSETSVLGAVYKHIGNNLNVGVGYNFGSFSDDLTDLTQDDQGAFINIIAKF